MFSMSFESSVARSSIARFVSYADGVVMVISVLLGAVRLVYFAYGKV